MQDIGYLQHGKQGEAMREQSVPVRNEYADKWQAFYEGKWRRVFITARRTFIKAYGEKITINIWGV